MTVEGGTRYLILCRKTKNVFTWPLRRPYVLLDAKIMTDAWKAGESKTIEKATLADFASICAKNKNPFTSVDKMMLLA